ncbi:hypothetical protein NXW78_28240 [Bacteroides ovatus]|nr:hypothetical protein [Bacteroides ovatus]
MKEVVPIPYLFIQLHKIMFQINPKRKLACSISFLLPRLVIGLKKIRKQILSLITFSHFCNLHSKDSLPRTRINSWEERTPNPYARLLLFNGFTFDELKFRLRPLFWLFGTADQQ